MFHSKQKAESLKSVRLWGPPGSPENQDSGCCHCRGHGFNPWLMNPKSLHTQPTQSKHKGVGPVYPVYIQTPALLMMNSWTWGKALDYLLVMWNGNNSCTFLIGLFQGEMRQSALNAWNQPSLEYHEEESTLSQTRILEETQAGWVLWIQIKHVESGDIYEREEEAWARDHR